MAISNANANGIPFIKNMRGIPKSIRDAMVLWYDINRQGATNESMIANPILKDLSGNGNDATCYNFAWSGMSGIGGYPDAKSNILSNISNNINISTNEHKVKMVYNKPANVPVMLGYDKISNYGINTKIKIKAGKYGLRIWQCTPGDYADVIIVLDLAANEEGEFIFSEEEYNKGKIEAQFGNGNIHVPANEPIEFEFLPLYPNALVSDGVDDYVMVQNRYDTPDLENWIVNSGVINANGNKLEIVSDGNLSQTIRYTITKDTKLKLKINGVSTDNKLRITFRTDIVAEIEENSIFEHTFIYKENSNNTISIGGVSGIMIEQLPINKSLVFNKEDGYTIIAKRERLNDFGCLASKRNSSNTDGAFVFELKTSANNYRCDSFSTQNPLSAFEESDITCQTSQRYNDTAIGIGDAPDNGVLNLFVLYNSYFGKIALYSFLLFDRNLTTEEIEWVKANLVEDDGYETL